MARSEYYIVKNDKSKWNDISGQLSGLCVFFTSNWLNSVSDSWSVNTVYEVNGQICGAIVFQTGSKYGIKTIMNPPMTPYHGIWINEEALRIYREKASICKKIAVLLIESLPDYAYINFRLLPSVADVQEFKWRGFYALVRYTCRLDRANDPYQWYASLHYKVRNSIAKAEKDLVFEETNNVAQHFSTVAHTFQRAKVKHPVSLETYNAMYSHLHRTGNAKMFCVKDHHGQIQASLLLVWDADTAYMISHGTVLNAHRGATSLLIWKAIEFSLQKNLVFDFEGSDIQRIASFYSGFGGVLTPYYQVVKIKNPILRALYFTMKKL